MGKRASYVFVFMWKLDLGIGWLEWVVVNSGCIFVKLEWFPR